MCMLRASFAASLVMACSVEEPDRLVRLTRAWAAETAEYSSPSLTGTVLMAGLANQLCKDQDTQAWSDLSPGQPLPITANFAGALGEPVVELVDAEDAPALFLLVSGVELLGRSETWLRINTVAATERYSVDIQVLEGMEAELDDVLRLPAYGQVGFEVDAACITARGTVRGTALWTDDHGGRQDVGIPADTDLGSAVAFDPGQPYLPVMGSMRWTARMGGQERTVTTEDAVELRVDASGEDLPIGRWPSIVRGAGWSGDAITVISP